MSSRATRAIHDTLLQVLRTLAAQAGADILKGGRVLTGWQDDGDHFTLRSRDAGPAANMEETVWEMEQLALMPGVQQRAFNWCGVPSMLLHLLDMLNSGEPMLF